MHHVAVRERIPVRRNQKPRPLAAAPLRIAPAHANDRRPDPLDDAHNGRGIGVESVDIAGNAAVAKIILDYPSVKFVDYMSLLKINGEWKIINKSFYAEPKTAPAEAKKP